MSSQPAAHYPMVSSLVKVLMTLVLVGLTSSCASTSGSGRVPEREPHAPLIVARSGNDALLSWQSLVGEQRWSRKTEPFCVG